MVLVSIVVPIYKVEKELPRCINSLLSQTHTNIEIILVDDGSPDGCPQICDTYKEKDGRVKVIHKQNGGLSDARNCGLIQSTGEYILFVDSDDYIKEDTCEKLIDAAVDSKAQIVVGEAIRVENNMEEAMNHDKSTINRSMNGRDFLIEQLKSHSMLMNAYMNLYSRNFLVDNKLYFKKGILHEDEQWTPRVFLKAQRVMHIDFGFYYYICRENSITHNPDTTQNGIDLIVTCNELEYIYSKLEDTDLKRLLNDYILTLYLHAVHYGNLYHSKYDYLINEQFFKDKACSRKNRVKINLFLFNRNLYKRCNQLVKSIELIKYNQRKQYKLRFKN